MNYLFIVLQSSLQKVILNIHWLTVNGIHTFGSRKIFKWFRINLDEFKAIYMFIIKNLLRKNWDTVLLRSPTTHHKIITLFTKRIPNWMPLFLPDIYGIFYCVLIPKGINVQQAFLSRSKIANSSYGSGSYFPFSLVPKSILIYLALLCIWEGKFTNADLPFK